MEGRPSLSVQCWTILRVLREVLAQFSRQMTAVRHPYERWTVVRLPEPVQSVLFVCKGNICRSPLAAAYFQSLNDRSGGKLTVRSAGLETTPGKPAHAKARAVALQHHLSVEQHATTQVSAEILGQSDLVVVMEIMQKIRIHKLYPQWKRKVVLLGRFDSTGPIEIGDPYNGAIEDFESCFKQISRCCDKLAAKLDLKSLESAVSPALPLSVEKP